MGPTCSSRLRLRPDLNFAAQSTIPKHFVLACAWRIKNQLKANEVFAFRAFREIAVREEGQAVWLKMSLTVEDAIDPRKGHSHTGAIRIEMSH